MVGCGPATSRADTPVPIERPVAVAPSQAGISRSQGPHVAVSPTAGPDPLAALTEREREILELMAQGLTNTGIARRLVLSDRTVEAHIRHLVQKIRISDGQDDHRRVLAVLTYLSSRS